MKITEKRKGKENNGEEREKEGKAGEVGRRKQVLREKEGKIREM